MACGATLKRSHDFDPLHSPGQGTPKRRRCMPMTLSPSTPPTKAHQLNPSPFADVTPKYTSEQIAASISLEIKKMQRRRQLQYPGSTSPPHPSMDMPSTSGMESPTSANSQSSLYNALSPSKKDVPLFTFRQVSMICERMVKDREDQIREEYNSVLTNKVAEQYEAFLKFNHDQLRRRFGDAPMSYVS
ncbi:akirin-2-like [Haliotis asinina]|uniref:Akirin 2 n=1 Tax=Haliotis diversicolor TaxID=36095 RepID=W8TPK2_HALDV|nr:akirin 2 [Haliotis diversicolor]